MKIQFVLDEIRYALNWMYYRIRGKRYNIIVGKKVRIHKETSFEGKNRVGEYTNVALSRLGRGSYLGKNCRLTRCDIGRYTSIADEVSLVAGKHPMHEYISTSPMFYSQVYGGGWSYVKQEYFSPYKFVDVGNRWSVKIGSDVWLGRGVKVFEGVTIGDGVVVGAFSLVTKNLEPYGIYVGSPAKLVGYRYDSSIVDLLMEYKWWNKEEVWIKENADLFRDIEAFCEMMRKEENE